MGKRDEERKREREREEDSEKVYLFKSSLRWPVNCTCIDYIKIDGACRNREQQKKGKEKCEADYRGSPPACVWMKRHVVTMRRDTTRYDTVRHGYYGHENRVRHERSAERRIEILLSLSLFLLCSLPPFFLPSLSLSITSICWSWNVV